MSKQFILKSLQLATIASALTISIFVKAEPATGRICGSGVNCPPDFVRPGDIHAQPYPSSPYRPDPSPYDPAPRPMPPRPRPNPPPYPPQPPRETRYTKQADLARYFRDETLDLVYLARLDDRYDRGSRIEAVEVLLQGNGRASLALYADRQLVDSSTYLSRSVILSPRRPLTVGYDFRNLQLSVGGKLFIDRVIIHLVRDERPRPYPGPGPGPQPYPGDDLEVRIDQSFYGHSQLDLYRMLNLYQYRGLEISEIEVAATSLSTREPASVELLVNGYSEGTSSVDQFNHYVHFMPRRAVIGSGADSILLDTRGDIQIESITVRFFRR